MCLLMLVGSTKDEEKREGISASLIGKGREFQEKRTARRATTRLGCFVGILPLPPLTSPPISEEQEHCSVWERGERARETPLTRLDLQRVSSL